MLLVYMIVVIWVAITTLLICHYFTLKNVTSVVLSVAATVFAVTITHAYILPHYVAWSIESQIRNQYAIFNYLAIHAPKDFNPYIIKVKKDVLSQADVSRKVQSDTRIFLNNELEKFAQIATDQSMYDYTKTLDTIYKNLILINPTLVLGAEFPDQFSTAKNQIQNETTNNTMMLEKEKVIKSAIETPQPPLSSEEMQQAKITVQVILLDLLKKYNQNNVVNTFAHPSDPGLDKKMAAAILIDFYNDLLSRGVKQTGLVMKFLLNPQSDH